MKIFYDNEGKVVGTFSGATEAIEQQAHMPGANETIAPIELAKRIADRRDELTIEYLRVDKGEVREMHFEEKEAQKHLRKEQKEAEKRERGKPVADPVMEAVAELRKEVEKLKAKQSSA